MSRRLELQALLESLLGSGNVYFQPPPSVSMKYPCIVFKLDGEHKIFANNKPYSRKARYSVTVIDKNPDSLIPAKIAELPMSDFNRFYSADNLNHTVYNLYY